MSDKQYHERDVRHLRNYALHVKAMTEEGLHSKSDIAAELAYRDDIADILAGACASRCDEIESLQQQLAETVEVIRRNNPGLEKYRSSGFINRDYDIGRVYVDLPIIEAKILLSKLKGADNE